MYPTNPVGVLRETFHLWEHPFVKKRSYEVLINCNDFSAFSFLG